MDLDVTAGAGEQPILQRSRDFYPLAEHRGSLGQEDVEMGRDWLWGSKGQCVHSGPLEADDKMELGG